MLPRCEVFWYLDFCRYCSNVLECSKLYCMALLYGSVSQGLVRTGNYQIHEFDWLKWILTAV